MNWSKRNARLAWVAATAALLLLEICIALFVRDTFVRPYLGDVLAVWTVYCAVRILCPLRANIWQSVCVFLFALLVELSQLAGLVDLLGAAESRFLVVLLGGTFDPADLVCYAVGCLLIEVIRVSFFRMQRAGKKPR